MLKIRLQVGGRNKHRKYRIVVAESSSRRDGKFVEIVGYYNPQPSGQDLKCQIKLERIDYWLGQGAQATETVAALVKKVRKGEAKHAAYAEAEAAPAAS